MGKIILRLDRVMADRKMSLNELSERVGVSNVNLSTKDSHCNIFLPSQTTPRITVSSAQGNSAQ